MATARSYTTTAFLALSLGVSLVALTAARWGSNSRNSRVEIVDFGKVVRATTPAFDARLAPPSDAGV
jgi:hypothetical protein